MSNFSPYANVKCEPQPSTSTANETTLPLNSPCHPSPALARSVPSSQEATSPSETAGKDFVFFTCVTCRHQCSEEDESSSCCLLTFIIALLRPFFCRTELANQAALDFEKERFDSLLEWHIKYRKRKEAERNADDVVSEKASSSVSTESTPVDTSERKPEKRKAESDPEDQVSKKPTYMDLSAPDVSTKKVEETPLRRMEMMTNSSAFSTSSSINDVVEAPANGLCKKDERSMKLEKLGEMERQVEAERLRVEWEKEVQAHEMKKLMNTQGLSPYPSPMYPRAPAPGPQGTLYPMSSFPTRYPPGSAPYPMGSMGYPQGYPNGTSFPPGYPMSAPGNSQIPSPAYIGDPLAFKGAAPPPGMSPHHPMYAHMMAARASAGMQSPVPGPGYPGDPSRLGFPMPGHSPSASPFYPTPFPPHPYAQMPYGHPGMTKGMVPPPPYPFPPSGMMPGGPGMPSNPGMMRSDAMSWQGGAPPNYPPSFPSVPGGPTPPVPCQHLTPPKQGLAV
ncbi:hypothetical protein COOONC_04916 [Cooperia oncophora]